MKQKNLSMQHKHIHAGKHRNLYPQKISFSFTKKHFTTVTFNTEHKNDLATIITI